MCIMDVVFRHSLFCFSCFVVLGLSYVFVCMFVCMFVCVMLVIVLELNDL